MEKQNVNEQNNTKKTRFSLAWKLLTVAISLLIIYTAYHVLFGLSESVATTSAGLATPSTLVTMSPASRPACSAQEPSVTELT